ncbi:protein MAIN-LIKE 1-like [Arachis hypogaea]|uniref:protein MAIN-LIKE 1-like n=1 Tax=Arachis hypogaea TaxID=3818 RepID=UPI003B16C348
MVEFEHDLPLASALIERWRPESHTFHLPCGEMNIILQDVAYQLGLRIDRGPISGCIGGWEQHHDGHPIEDFCQQLLGIVLGPEDRQSQTKWTVKLSWFQNTICGDVEEDPTEERLLCYTRGYIMQVIMGIGYVSMAILPDVRATEHSQRNLGGCVSLPLSWAYHCGLSTIRIMPKARTSLDITDVDWMPYTNLQLQGVV